MKKILTLFAVVGLFAFSGCSNDNVDNDTISYVFETTIDFTGPNYQKNVPAQGMLSGDNILVYELVSAPNEADRWALLPQIYYFNNGTETAQYNYTFSKNNVTIFIDGSLSDLSGLPSTFRLGKTFRIVIVPGDDGINAKKTFDKSNYLDYNAVIKKYNINDSNVKKIN